MPDHSTIITIDGPSGSGKSTISRLLAARLNYTYLDTGAMYRAVGLAMIRAGINENDLDALQNLLETINLSLAPGSSDTIVRLNGEDVSEAIRTAEMGMVASRVSALHPVRTTLTDLQRRIGAGGSIVAEGRDMGTVVFPQATNKFFLSATASERAARRTLQLQEKGLEADYTTILHQIEKRDRDDSARDLAPLKAATDAIDVDSSHMTIDEVVDFMLQHISQSNPQR